MFTLPVITAQLTPIIVCSPTIRSGTTLLQRLLCSAPNTIIYGETVAQDIELFLNLYVNKTTIYIANKARFEVTRSKVVDQATDDWMIDLVPDLDGYLNAIGQSCFAGLIYCQDYAREIGCTVWGLKYPGWKPPMLTLIQRTIPNTRLIYIYRDILDCIRSAKAWLPTWSVRELTEFCVDWTTNLTYALSLATQPNVMLMKYEELIDSPNEMMNQIASFTGAQGMQERVFERKFNNSSEGRAAQTATYRMPVALTDAEFAIVEEFAIPLRTRVYSTL